MAPLRKLLDKVAPLFEAGGKYERLYPLYEAADSFLFTPDKRSEGAVHVHDGMDNKRLMVTVVIGAVVYQIRAADKVPGLRLDRGRLRDKTLHPDQKILPWQVVSGSDKNMWTWQFCPAHSFVSVASRLTLIL